MDSQEQIKDYSSIKKEIEPAFPGAEKADMAGILNQKIIIKDFKAYPSSIAGAEGKEFVVILAELNGKLVSFNSGEVVLKQLKDIKDKLPIRTTITKPKGKRYYTLS
jgi:hypothetical protein